MHRTVRRPPPFESPPIQLSRPCKGREPEAAPPFVPLPNIVGGLLCAIGQLDEELLEVQLFALGDEAAEVVAGERMRRANEEPRLAPCLARAQLCELSLAEDSTAPSRASESMALTTFSGLRNAILCRSRPKQARGASEGSHSTLSHRQWVAEDKNSYANTRLFRCARAPQTF